MKTLFDTPSIGDCFDYLANIQLRIGIDVRRLRAVFITPDHDSDCTAGDSAGCQEAVYSG